MSDSGEVVVTTEGTGQMWSAGVWDPKTGTMLMTYKGAGPAGSHSACFLGNDYLLLSDQTKPVLHAWPLNSQHPAQAVRLVCPGKVNALAVSPDGCYCVTAIADKLHVWQIASGRHLAVAHRHFQPVACVRFTDDGSHFISGGEDGQVLVWPLAYLISSHGGVFFSGQTEPRFMFSDHGLAVRDIYVGAGGMRAHCFSVSLDKSCRIYDLSSGLLLAALIFDGPLSAITLNAIETEGFVGLLNGKIIQFNLGSLPRMREHHLTPEEKDKVFVGHSKLVSCLSVSQDGTMLLSGSADRQVILWDIPSRQSIRTIEHKGPVTNAFFATAPKHIFSDDFKPSIILNSFQRSMEDNEGNLVITVRTTEDCWYEDDLEYQSKIPAVVDDTEIKEKLMEVTKKNADLYRFAVEKIFSSVNNKKKSNEEEEMEIEMECSNSEESQSEEERRIKKKGKKNKKIVQKKKSKNIF